MHNLINAQCTILRKRSAKAITQCTIMNIRTEGHKNRRFFRQKGRRVNQCTMHDAQSRTEVYLLTERHKGHILDRRAGGREEFGGLKVDFGVLALNIGGFLS